MALMLNNKKKTVSVVSNSSSTPLPILPSVIDDDDIEVRKEHDAQPVTNIDDINRMITSLLNRGRWRDAMLFVVGINTGLRYSDFIRLRFKNLIDNEGFFRDELVLIEQKTRNTKGKKRGSATANPMNRHIYLNEAVRKIVRIFLEHREVSLDDFLFYNESYNYRSINKGLSPTAINKIFTNLSKELGVEGRHSTHFMRKTFSYHFLTMSGVETQVENRSLQWLQSALHHSDPITTLRYAGFLDGEIKNFYSRLNLGLDAINQFLGEASSENERSVEEWA